MGFHWRIAIFFFPFDLRKRSTTPVRIRKRTMVDLVTHCKVHIRVHTLTHPHILYIHARSILVKLESLTKGSIDNVTSFACISSRKITHGLSHSQSLLLMRLSPAFRELFLISPIFSLHVDSSRTDVNGKAFGVGKSEKSTKTPRFLFLCYIVTRKKILWEH